MEYEQGRVKVHDIVHKKEDKTWLMVKSFYYKLRLSKQWVIEHIKAVGFQEIDSMVENGMVTLIAEK